MASKKTAFLRPDIDFSDDDDDMSMGNGARKISNKIKKCNVNLNAIKNPNKYYEEDKVTKEYDDDDDEPEVVLTDDDDSPVKKPKRSNKRKSDFGSGDKKKSKKAKRRDSDSDDEFLPEDDEKSDEDDDEEDVASEDLSDDNISDSDFNPESEEEGDVEGYETPGRGATIHLSSDGDASPEKRDSTKTFDTNGQEFWDKVQELRSKGFSIQQAGNGDTNSSKIKYDYILSMGTDFLSKKVLFSYPLEGSLQKNNV